MRNAIAWWARNPVAANLLMFAFIIAGLLGYSQMEREVIPTVTLNSVAISVAWPGASPKDVEEQIITRIEARLGDLDNVEKLTSTAVEGLANVEVEASPKADMNAFINQIKLRIDSIHGFPRSIEPPQVEEVLVRTDVVKLALHGSVEELALKRLAQKLRDEMVLLPGISIVQLSGARQEEVSVELSELAMRRYQLNFDQVADAIRSSSINFSAGSLRTQTGKIQLRANNFALNQSDFENIVVSQSVQGGVVKVGDIARVIDGFEEVDVLTRLNGEPAVFLEVVSSETIDVVKISKTVKAWIETKQKELPSGIKLTLWWDSADTYQNRMAIIGDSAFSGLMLVFLVLILSLRPKIALWVTLGIATAYAGSFALLPANDVSINILSTFAFLLVLGIVVDDAIVVGESIHDQSDEDGRSNVDKAILGAQLVAKPVLYAVLTTMIAFIPWFFISGEDAQVTRHISIVIVLALTFSLVEAFFILPAHLSQLKPRDDRNRFFKLQRRIEQSILNFAHRHYRRIVQSILNNSYLTLSIFVAFFIVSVGLISSGWVKFSFTPEIGNDQVSFEVTLAEGTPYSRVLDVLESIQNAERQLEKQFAFEDDAARLVDNRYVRVLQENIVVTIKLSPKSADLLAPKTIADRWRKLTGDIPDAEKINVVYKTRQAPPIEYSISHPDLDVLNEAVVDFKAQLGRYETVYDIRDNLQTVSEELHFTLLPGAKRWGISLAEISRQVRQAYYGEEAQRLPRYGNDVKVMVRYPKQTRESLDSLKNFRVRTPTGDSVPLLALVEVEYRPGATRIERTEGQRSAKISAQLSSGSSLDIQADLNKNFVDQWKQKFPGVSLGDVGESDGKIAFIKELLSLYVVALFLMYAIVAVAFRSYTQPFIVLIAIPFGFMGAVYGHLIYGVPMTLFSYFGVGAAAGVVVNDNLVFIDYINRLRAQGMDWYDAVVEAGVKRFRPIILTSATTFFGLLPMMSEPSLQAQFLRPTVISLAFGVLLAAIVTLGLVPALYAIRIAMHGRLSRIKQRWTKKAGALLVTASARD